MNAISVPAQHVTLALVSSGLVCLCSAASATTIIGVDGRPGAVPEAVQITCPRPEPAASTLVPPTFQIQWQGPPRRDLRMPFEYRFILLGPSSEFPVALAVSNPEAFRDYYANHPLGPWTGWSSTSAHTPNAGFADLVPATEHLFAVIALGRDGDFSPEFSLSTNMLHFVAGYPSSSETWSPVITMSGPGFRHTYADGGYFPGEASEIPTQMRSHQRATFRWSAEPGFMCDSPRIRWYRWALDIADLTDETPRIDEETDLSHWSAKSLDATSARLGPFQPGEVHRLHVEAEDEVGLRSLGTVRIEVLPPGGRGELALTVEAARGGRTEVSYSLPEDTDVEIAVYDVTGRRVATLENAARLAGTHTTTWSAPELGQGVYFIRMRTETQTVTTRAFLVK